MANLAIKGHETRGKEVIEILEMLRGENKYQVTAFRETYVYFVDEDTISFLQINQLLPEQFNIFTLEEFLEKFPYKIGDKVQDLKYGEVFTIDYMFWNEKECTVYYFDPNNLVCHTVENLKLYKEIKEMSNNITLNNPYKEGEKKSLLASLIEHFRTTPKDELEREWNEHNELDEIGPTVEEYIAFVESIKKQPQYPKTFIEVLNFWHPNRQLEDDYQRCYKKDLIEKFQDLLYARDAYWEIAGEQMGLKEPWKPDWDSLDKKYDIYNYRGDIKYDYFTVIDRCLLVFPTEEIRDVFYENFKNLIEECKELL